MKKIIFTVIMLCCITIKSIADDSAPTSGTCNSSGTCLWNLSEDGTLTISAKDGAENVKMGDYFCRSIPCEKTSLIARPWEESIGQIKNVVIGDNISYIGDDAFQSASNLESVTGMNDLKKIGSVGVFAGTGLTSITIPDSVTGIGSYAFSNAKSLSAIIIPDSWADEISLNLNSGMFLGSCFSFDRHSDCPADTRIICQGNVEKCKISLAKFLPSSSNCPENAECNCSGSGCLQNPIFSPATETQCNGINYYWNGVSCDNKKDGINCADGYYATNYDLCEKIKLRYTLPEADAATSDDNENMIEWIFE